MSLHIFLLRQRYKRVDEVRLCLPKGFRVIADEKNLSSLSLSKCLVSV